MVANDAVTNPIDAVENANDTVRLSVKFNIAAFPSGTPWSYTADPEFADVSPINPEPSPVNFPVKLPLNDPVFIPDGNPDGSTYDAVTAYDAEVAMVCGIIDPVKYTGVEIVYNPVELLLTSK